MNSIVTKWQFTGLLVNLSEDKKLQLATQLEEITQFMVKANIKAETITGNVLIPVARRAVDNGLKLSTSTLLEEFAEYVLRSNTKSMDEMALVEDFSAMLKNKYAK
jgi:hypothetical protein